MAESSGTPARGYSWPPFEPGITAALTHGANSEHALAPRAEVILAGYLASYPPMITEDPVLAGELAALAKLEAVQQLYERFMADKPLEDLIKGALPIAEQYQRAIVRASNIRRGLDRARIDRARTAATVHRAGLADLAATGEAIIARRAAELAATGPTDVAASRSRHRGGICIPRRSWPSRQLIGRAFASIDRSGTLASIDRSGAMRSAPNAGPP